MKKLFSLLVISFVLVQSNVSCSDNNEGPIQDVPDEDFSDESENPIEEVDDKYYLVLRNDGKLFKIGDKSGELIVAGSISGMNPDYLLVFNSIVVTPERIFVYAQNYNPVEGYLYIYNRDIGTTQITQLDFSDPAFGVRPALVSMDWNSNNNSLIAIITSEAGYPGGYSNVIQIDPLNLEVMNLGIELGQPIVLSTVILNSKLYASSSKIDESSFDDFLEIDIEQKSFRSLNLDLERAMTQLSVNNKNNILFGYSKGATGDIQNDPTIPNLGNRSEPFTIDIDTGQYLKVLPETQTASGNFNVKSFFDTLDNQHLSFIYTHDFDGIMRYNIANDEITFIDGAQWQELKTFNKSIIASIPK